ncbi:MAG: hypothetical protein P8J33_05405 [Pirellulaceae bacterium]|nr:hypothetical protein [Pirellulaceae bacterium]
MVFARFIFPLGLLLFFFQRTFFGTRCMLGSTLVSAGVMVWGFQFPPEMQSAFADALGSAVLTAANNGTP